MRNNTRLSWATAVIISATLWPLSMLAQNCPITKTVSGYVVFQLSKKYDTSMFRAKGKDRSYLMPIYDAGRTWVTFVPQDSVSRSKPLSYWIKTDYTFPALYSLWNEGGLRRVLNERCGIKYSSLDLTYDYPYPEASSDQVKMYEMDGAEKDKWYYLVYYLKAEWWYTLLTESDKKQFSFGSDINPPPPITGNTPYFGIKKILKYTIEASFKDAKLHPYKLPGH